MAASWHIWVFCRVAKMLVDGRSSVAATAAHVHVIMIVIEGVRRSLVI